MRVLVVDDDPDIQELLRIVLQGQGAVVETAGTVLSAVSRIAVGQYDYLILDYKLPDGTGFDVLELSDLPDTRAVLYTATHCDPELQMRALFLGIDTIFQKSSPVSSLIDYIITRA